MLPEFGGRDLSADAPVQGHDFIHFRLKLSGINSNRCIELYKKGLPFSDIAKEVCLSKSSVIGYIKKYQKSLKDDPKFRDIIAARKRQKRSGTPPYGYLFLEGKKVEHPAEQFLVQKIMKLSGSDHGPRAIAEHLNGLKIKSRRNGKWHHGVISAIIQRSKLMKD